MNAFTSETLYHDPNTDIVKMSCRDHPSIAIEIDRISELFDALSLIARRCKAIQDEESYAETIILAELLQRFLRDYEREVGLDERYPAYEIPIDQRSICYADIES